MKISGLKMIWFVISLIISGLLAYVAYDDPMKFVPFTDLLATIISILIGMSLAISAILSTRPMLSKHNYSSDEEKDRIEKIIKKDNLKLQDGQFLLFWFYYASLIMAVVLKFLGIHWADADQELINVSVSLKSVSACFVFIASLSLLWSATLPSLLRGINAQRSMLE